MASYAHAPSKARWQKVKQYAFYNRMIDPIDSLYVHELSPRYWMYHRPFYRHEKCFGPVVQWEYWNVRAPVSLTHYWNDGDPSIYSGDHPIFRGLETAYSEYCPINRGALSLLWLQEFRHQISDIVGRDHVKIMCRPLACEFAVSGNGQLVKIKENPVGIREVPFDQSNYPAESIETVWLLFDPFKFEFEIMDSSAAVFHNMQVEESCHD